MKCVLHPFQTGHQGHAWTTKIQPDKALAAWPKGRAIIQGYFSMIEKELVLSLIHI